ncbi:MAG: hypothetical protein IJH11_01985 [Lachnospiraceae bacterium]|nr:hypothetical protein [Lachnospiraceae bacterium]
METLKLNKPIKVNGKDVDEVTYDINEIDGILFATADAKKKAAAGMKTMSLSPAAEFDFGFHLYLGYAAIIAVNPQFEFEDLERIKGKDAVEVMKIGRNFILSSEQDSQESGSENATETTPESTTPAKPTSKEKE